MCSHSKMIIQLHCLKALIPKSFSPDQYHTTPVQTRLRLSPVGFHSSRLPLFSMKDSAGDELLRPNRENFFFFMNGRTSQKTKDFSIFFTNVFTKHFYKCLRPKKQLYKLVMYNFLQLTEAGKPCIPGCLFRVIIDSVSYDCLLFFFFCYVLRCGPSSLKPVIFLP